MNTDPLSRRVFLHSTLGALAAAGLTRPAAQAAAGDESRGAASRALRLGGPSFAGTDDPEEQARWHRQAGYRAAYCPNVSLKDTTRIKAFAEAYAKHDVAIAEVGRWCNLLDPDPGQRKKNVENVTGGLALADEIGALCCVDIAGSFNPKVWYGPHPDNFSPKFFEAAVENARKIIDAVKPKRARFCYEMMGWAMPESPARYRRMIEAVDRPAFAVHLDPCNLVNSPERFYDTTALLNDCFDQLGRWVVSCHAKDLVWDVEMNIHFREVRPGAGSLDYTTYLKRLAALPQNPPLMIEHLPDADEYRKAARHLIELGQTLGLPFG